jgi:hypothetical protein
MSKPFMTITKDFHKNFKDAIEALKHKETLVGIPADDSAREPDANGKMPINNAALLAINEFGSPANNIPSRPVVRIGLWDSRDEVTAQFKKAAQEVFSKGQAVLDKYFERAGIIASNRIKMTINNQVDIEPPAASTLKARKYLNNGNGFRGIKALVVTGQMRNAITYVVRSKKI